MARICISFILLSGVLVQCCCAGCGQRWAPGVGDAAGGRPDIPAVVSDSTPFPLGHLSGEPVTHFLWYDTPSSDWNEALPIGNGRSAAMVFGSPEREHLQLNEETVWAGGPNNNVNPGALPIIRKARRLLFEEKYVEAQRLVDRELPPYGNSGMPYQPVGDLFVSCKGHERYSGYSRMLDLERAVASVAYVVDGVTFRREAFASLSNGVIVLRLTADHPGRITCTASLRSEQRATTSAEAGRIVLTGRSGDWENLTGSVYFRAEVAVLPDGGSMKVSGDSMSVEGADAVTFLLAIGTNFRRYNDITGDPGSRCDALLKSALAVSYRDLRSAHVTAYAALFGRVNLDLGRSGAIRKTTVERIRNFRNGDDPQFAATYFQFGRYLLISSSLPGSQPATLQGKWNPHMAPPWDCKYTININTEMNYWPAEVANLAECHEPLVSMLEDLSLAGTESARTMYGARGWCAHHNTDIWRITGQVDPPFYGLWPMGGAWLSRHLWEHYQYGGDRDFLARVYPILRGAAAFFVDALQEEPTHKWLVVAPSISPENAYMKSEGVSITAGCTMDNQLVHDLFSNTIDAARELGVDQALCDTLRRMRDRLPPMQIGKHGQLQEWLSDWDDPGDRHRHVSHLFGLYPGTQITPGRHPELFEAARTTLVQRGDVSTGWSMGWKVNLWARLLDGNHAYRLITDQLRLVTDSTEKGAGGTYANLLDAHPPFQIDGNFGCTSGIAEMLLQSHDEAVHVLPALPDAWPSGSVRGLRARGGFELDIDWKGGQVNVLTVRSALGGICRLRVAKPLIAPDGTEPAKASGANPNGFYRQAEVKAPLVAGRAQQESGVSGREQTDDPATGTTAGATQGGVRSYVEYDISTRRGETYTFKGK